MGVQCRIREDALAAAPKRVELLESSLGLHELAARPGATLPSDARRELSALEVLVAGRPRGDALAESVAKLKRRASACEEAAPIADAPSAEVLQQSSASVSLPVPPADLKILTVAGDDAERRLLASLRGQKVWTPFSGSLLGFVSGLKVQHEPSEVRRHGRACATSFVVDGWAKDAFVLLRKLHAAGSLDHGFHVRWSRALDDDGHNVARHLSEVSRAGRGVFCIDRFARVGARPAQSAEDPEQYLFASTSLVPDLLAGAGLPKSSENDARPWHIYVYGAVFTDVGSHECRVDFMADVDPSAAAAAPEWMVDREVRLQMLRSADRLRRELRRCSATGPGGGGGAKDAGSVGQSLPSGTAQTRTVAL